MRSSASAAATDVPNNSITPGALNPAVRQDNIDTACAAVGSRQFRSLRLFRSIFFMSFDRREIASNLDARRADRALCFIRQFRLA
jgi:hypothetical protein